MIDMKKDKFVNLHRHTDYSQGDATIKIPELFYEVQKNNQKAVAITDHGNIVGWSQFFLLGQDTNVKPIFGCEFYCTPSTDKPQDNNRYHLVVLAKDDEGAKNLSKLEYLSTAKYFYRRPLLPYPILFDNPEGLFISTACSLGTIGQCFNPDNKNHFPHEAEPFLNKLLDVFGKENVAAEFQFHPAYPPQKTINSKLLDLYSHTDMKYRVATTDAHFISDRNTRRHLQADMFHKQKNDVTPSLPSNCLGTSKLVKQFAEQSGFEDLTLVDTMIKNTSIIADKCNVTSINNIGKKRVLPTFTKHQQLKKIFLKEPRRR